MIFKNVAIEEVVLIKPPKVVTSEQIELRIQPVYEKLRLSVGRLELMTGIKERRFWEPKTRSSDVATLAGKKALEKSQIDKNEIECLIHASVCKDFLEPATAAIVHEKLGLSENCAIFDISNACLGVLTAMVQVATMIEMGYIKAGMVVSGETAEPLYEATIKNLISAKKLTKSFMKEQFASLTIGSAATAVILRKKDEKKHSHTLIAASTTSDTTANKLCMADPDESNDAGPVMKTDSEALLNAGCKLAAKNWEKLKNIINWNNDSPNHIFTHQVGKAHTKLVIESMGLNSEKDFPTYQFMGNTGSAALPGAWAIGIDEKPLKENEKVALLGIGSGLATLILGIKW